MWDFGRCQNGLALSAGAEETGIEMVAMCKPLLTVGKRVPTNCFGQATKAGRGWQAIERFAVKAAQEGTELRVLIAREVVVGQ